MPRLFCALAVLALGAVPASAEEAVPPGAYEVSYRLELPHVETGVGDSAKLCLAGGGAFPVLSANNPLAHCPAKNIRREGREVSFEIVCPGGNAAKATALFDITATGFDGRIAMNMGGKNMTMTEVQHGRRIGDCDAATQ